jgi:hypothetical protein
MADNQDITPEETQELRNIIARLEKVMAQTDNLRRVLIVAMGAITPYQHLAGLRDLKNTIAERAVLALIAPIDEWSDEQEHQAAEIKRIVGVVLFGYRQQLAREESGLTED